MTPIDELTLRMRFNANRGEIVRRLRELEGRRAALVDYLIDECLPESLKETFDAARNDYERTEQLINIYRNWIK